MLGAVVHALAKALLFASLSAPEGDGISLDDARGLAARHPLPAAAFLVGAFAVVGVPPTFGFLAHWRIFGALAPMPGLLFPTLGAAMLMVAVYARAIGVFWWGGDSTEPPARISPVLSAALLLLMVVLLAAGILPPWSGRIA
jgi:formate hydrogenlyase subunit 3/multisubunit Na+/H+ antiporter MnhD subunit